MTQHSQEYTTAGGYTFNVPAGVSGVIASGIAGGGGSGVTQKSGVANGQSAAAGGAGESCDNVFVAVTASGTLAVTVGAGGAGGLNGVNGTNVHAGPAGSVSSGAGFGGGDTIIGDKIRLVGGYGGLSAGSSPHAGMGGGIRAWKGTNTKGGSLADNGEYLGAANPGGWCFTPNGPRHFGGPGGGSGGGGDGTVRETGGVGGSLGPYVGGAVAAFGALCDSGGSGAASPYGPGGDGGDGSDTATAIAPTVPAASYGCGAGAPGGTKSGAPTATKYAGTAGHDGYVLLTWFEP